MWPLAICSCLIYLLVIFWSFLAVDLFYRISFEENLHNKKLPLKLITGTSTSISYMKKLFIVSCYSSNDSDYCLIWYAYYECQHIQLVTTASHACIYLNLWKDIYFNALFEILILFEVWFSLLSVLQNGAALCREGINLKKKKIINQLRIWKTKMKNVLKMYFALIFSAEEEKRIASVNRNGPGTWFL